LLNVVHVTILQGRQVNSQQDKSWLFPRVRFYILPLQRAPLSQLPPAVFVRHLTVVTIANKMTRPSDNSQAQGTESIVSHQPPINSQLTPEDVEQLKGMQKWAKIREKRRKAAGLPKEGSGK
jgi:hypothetical protein